jgi:hypothetical protein
MQVSPTFTIPAGIDGYCAFHLIEQSQSTTTEPATHTVTILDLSAFKVTAVDWPVKFIDQNSTFVGATLSLNSSILISTYFPNTQFALQSSSRTVYSKNVVLTGPLDLQIEFPNGQSFQPGIYCLEV